MLTRIVNADKRKIMLETIKKRKETAYYREGSFLSEIILGKTKFLFPTEKMDK